MPLNIPMPDLPGNALLKGLNTGSTLFSRYMQPIIQREQLAEQGQYHRGSLAHQQKQLEQQALHQQQQLEFQNRQLAQSHAFDSLKKQMMQQQLLKLKNSNDPMHEFQQIQQLAQMFGGGADNQTNTVQDSPTIPFGEGQGMFNPEAMTQSQNKPQSNPMLDALKQNPMLRGFFKHKFGYDPLNMPQTPEEKNANSLELYKQKLAIKSANQQATANDVPLTPAMSTKLQSVVVGVDNALPTIEEFIKNYKDLPTGSETINPSAYAAYNSKANGIIEPLINAYGLNVTDETKKMMHEQVYRRTNEPLIKYRNRLIDLGKEVLRRRNDSFNGLKTGRINTKSMYTNEYFENLKNERKIIDGKEYQKVNGEWHEI